MFLVRKTNKQKTKTTVVTKLLRYPKYFLIDYASNAEGLLFLNQYHFEVMTNLLDILTKVWA